MVDGLCRLLPLGLGDRGRSGARGAARAGPGEEQPGIASLVFTLEGERPGAPRRSWLGATQRRAADLLGGPVRRARPRDLARELLENFLLEGPRTGKQVWKFARASKIAERTLRRAKEELEVRTVRAVFGERSATYWLLPGQDLPDQAPVQVREHELTPWLNALREKYQAKPEGSKGTSA